MNSSCCTSLHLVRPDDVDIKYPLPHEAERMSAQDVYTVCASHMMRQRQPAIDGDDLTCRYRAGRMACGVGAVMPQAWYTERIETMTIGEILEHSDQQIIVPAFRAFLRRHQPLLQDIQACHDAEAVNTWRQRLEQIACAYGLSWHCLARFDATPAEAYSPSEHMRWLARRISE